MTKQKTVPELKAEIAANERQHASSGTNSSSLKTVLPTTRKATAGNGRTGLLLVEPLWRAWPRWQRF